MSAVPSTPNSTNAEILLRLLNEPKSSPMMGWFIMMAIEEYAERVIAAGPKGLDNPMVTPEDLIACAHEAKEAMEEWQM
jgi:hypothetical protein